MLGFHEELVGVGCVFVCHLACGHTLDTHTYKCILCVSICVQPGPVGWAGTSVCGDGAFQNKSAVWLTCTYEGQAMWMRGGGKGGPGRSRRHDGCLLSQDALGLTWDQEGADAMMVCGGPVRLVAALASCWA